MCFETAPDIATVNRVQRFVPTLAQRTSTSVVIRANQSTIRSVFGLLRPWPRFRTLGICFPSGGNRKCGCLRHVSELDVAMKFCNIIDLCLRAQGAMKEACIMIAEAAPVEPLMHKYAFGRS